MVLMDRHALALSANAICLLKSVPQMTPEMPLSGVKDLIPFLTRLDDLHVSYTLQRCRPESIMVTITLVGARVEIDFFDDHIEYSVFKGNEEVLEDQPALFGMIRDFVEE